VEIFINMPNISVIVAVYNAEKYLRSCIDSIRGQTFRNFELLLIDDFSSDTSLRICEEYAQIDIRIKVYHKKVNEGTAQARKTGISYASAEYVIFVDNDDWIEAEMLEKMYSKAVSKNYDMVFCDFYHGEECLRQNCEYYDKYALIKQIISHRLALGGGGGNFYPVTWNKLVKKEIYERVVFPSITYAEDIAIMTQVLFYCNTIGYLSEALYHWRIVPKSASRNKKNGIKNLLESYISYISVITFIRNNMENTDEFMDEIMNHVEPIGFACSDNNKIINAYRNSMRKMIMIITGDSSDTGKIMIEKEDCEKEIRRLDRKDMLKTPRAIAKALNEIKEKYTRRFKRRLKRLLKLQ
jgi:glycosyltransferase involved in cell wall biosynthesis